MTNFTASSLPIAVKKLFESNHYTVEGPIHIHGAEIDLVATPKADPFGAPIYIEVTTEHVDNSKYGKDVGKLAMMAEVDPQARRLIVSSSGFTLQVQERAAATRIETLTYAQLFKKFEQFDPYITGCLDQADLANELRRLSDIYEEPNFQDAHGNEQATSFLTDWKNDKSTAGKWLLITGEYGTGKTALTKVLQYRWLNNYREAPDLALPLRIELREFANQFNARGLLHHFLDHHGLGHISLDFVFSLIRSGRVILILDGYDEMAQYLHARERRACLEALAQLSAGGARGIITSRPNYFTETEEFQMYEVLYSSLEYGKYSLSADAVELLKKEKQVDQLLERFIDRYERALKDLTPEQTEKLISRVLFDDEEGRLVVLGILSRIFRRSEERDDISLSGKPVIVSYLLEVVEGLKSSNPVEGAESLTEWQIYKLIVDQLMLRDFQRSPEILPDRRRSSLQKLAVKLSQRGRPTIEEEEFKDLVAGEYQNDIRRLSSEAQPSRVESLFADLRSSATLTRGGTEERYGWRFSHNTLREFLSAEALVIGLMQDKVVQEDIVVSDAMKLFAASADEDTRKRAVAKLTRVWQQAETARGRGQLLSLFWGGFLTLMEGDSQRAENCLTMIAGNPPQMKDILLRGVRLSTSEDPVSMAGADFSGAQIADVDFSCANMASASFSESVLEEVDFTSTNLEGARFDGALLVDAIFVDTNVTDTDFTAVDEGAISIVILSQGDARRSVEGLDALGYLQFYGAKTRELRADYVLQYHHAYWVVDKILNKLAEQMLRQRRGLEQRGAAQQDVGLAGRFVSHLIKRGLISTQKGRKDLVSVTERGRTVFTKYAEERELSQELLEFFGMESAR